MHKPITRLVLKVPSLNHQAAAEDVSSALALSPGIGYVEPDWRTGTLIVETASDDNGLDVLRKLREAGYPAVDGGGIGGQVERGQEISSVTTR